MSATATVPSSAPAPAASPVGDALSAERFAQHLAQRSYLPAWWLDAKRAAYEQFQQTPFPGRTAETWRFSSTLNDAALTGFDLPEDPAINIPNYSTIKHAAEIIYSNRQLVARSPLPADLAAKGVIYAPLDEALRNHSDLVQKYFQKLPANLGSEKFVALNTAFTAAGALLYVPKGVEIAAPFVLQHTLSGDNKAVFPHTLVILEDQARATLVEFFVSAEAGARHLASGVNDLHAGPGAHLTYVGAQAWSQHTLAFQSNSIVAERDARVLSLNVHLGGKRARHESHSRLLGPGAHSEMLALTIASGAQEFDQRTLQTHAAPHTSSNLLYKNALLDTAKTIFSGLIIVEPDAQKTDAYQSNRNLMLSDTAEANSLPGLEIEANDVRCTHGSTTSRIEPEQQFYLQARGIDPKNAHELLVFGFFEEVLGKLDNPDLHDALVTLIRTKFKK
ncbi:Fe-S cluster assembly protein SufD [Opitutaceae bacterium TAV4]|uniref:Fe-S cluster assembly protein SufD n=1 Tax=Geminisphaera colitermitum TaxID=1148786 RepID=UPI000158D498|nr:Fe-S cluster assembly protein SufD [Geminisphaera colitermitum]RRJ94881.1 Fe-S cluster assembly protein SufD [Opitutaceae bacterium TAV4]RRJ99123.1 Fe-S cluster assembly protein SufD [Opitutaceae bacterium TAV3]